MIITGATVVKLPNGGKLQHYLTRNLFNLGLLNFLILGLKSSFLKGCSLVLSRFGFRMYGSVKEIVIANGIPFKCVSSLTDPGYFKFLKNSSPDLILSSNSLYILKNLELPRLGCINRLFFAASLRGFYSFLRFVEKEKIGITILE